jgi:hypothetical protein
MRLIKTSILRLYIDTDLREQIRGDLRALPGKKTFPFKNNAELLSLLRSLVNEVVKNSPAPSAPDEQDHDPS